jgi:hypothetical protein
MLGTLEQRPWRESVHVQRVADGPATGVSKECAKGCGAGK